MQPNPANLHTKETQTKHRTAKHKGEHHQPRKTNRIIRRRIIPSLLATMETFLTLEQADATVETWQDEGELQSDPSNKEKTKHKKEEPMEKLLHRIDEIMQNYTDITVDDIENYVEESNPEAYLAIDNMNDTLTQAEMLKAPDRDEFLKAQEKELQGLIDMGVWEYQKISELPPGARLINSVWSYRRKRQVTGELLKYKARICADGRQKKQGIDYFESYAPVVGWATVRLVLILSVLLDLHCRQADFTQAFPQADIDTPVYLRMPEGWKYIDENGESDYCLKLVKNLYGTKQAARGWFLHLRDGLKEAGFYQSQASSCVFLSLICIIFV